MRREVILLLASCGGAAPPSLPAAPVEKPAVRAVTAKTDVIDPMAALAATTYPKSFIVPGLASLDLGGPSIQAPPAQPELAVTIIDEQSAMVRVAVKLDKLAFALWTERPRLLEVVTSNEVVHKSAGGGYQVLTEDAPVAIVHAGAHVRVLGHQASWTHVRYLGALEIEGWLPDAALGDRTTADPPGHSRYPTGLPTLMVTPGTIVRTEPKWAADQIAVMANGYFLDTIKAIDDEWALIGYEDGEIRVRGFASRRSPPGRVHKPHELEGAPAAITANGIALHGTCLYAKPHGEAIGFVTADAPVEVSAGRSPQWFTLTFDTPWGPLLFAAHGTSDADLDLCASTP